jgi:hypothetical protein
MSGVIRQQAATPEASDLLRILGMDSLLPEEVPLHKSYEVTQTVDLLFYPIQQILDAMKSHAERVKSPTQTPNVYRRLDAAQLVPLSQLAANFMPRARR